MNTFLTNSGLDTLVASFAYPWILVAAPLIAALFLARRQSQPAVSIPSLEIVHAMPKSFRLLARGFILAVLSAIVIVGITIAAAVPQRITTVSDVKKRRNIVLALDLSRSMATIDFDSGFGRISRISAVKSVVKKFIDARPDDRIGIVVFGTQAFVQAPLTLDHAVLEELLNEIRIGTAGEATAIGDGLGISLKRLKDVPPQSSTIILLTDGVSNSGLLEPLTVADIAKQTGIKIDTIGIGSSDGAVDNGQIFGSQSQEAEFDEATLKKIATATGGVYFNAHNLTGLEQVYEQIDKLERSEKEDPKTDIIDQLFAPFASFALLAYAIYLIAARWLFLKVP